MPAANTDKLMEVGLSTATTLSAPGYTIAGTSITVGATTNWPTATGMVFAMDTVTVVGGVEVQDAGSYNEFIGTVASATSITNVDWVDGNADRNYSAGASTRVYIPVSKTRENRIVEWGLVEHNQAGTHSAITATSVTVATGKITTTAVGKLEDMAVPLTTYRTNYLFDFVASGGVWTADGVGASLNASMTAMICYINGRRLSIGAVTARAFTTNVDTYIDVLDNADGTGTLVYTTAATNAASSALAANSLRVGIIQAAATITAATKVNQGQEDRVFPIASSIPYAVTDSLGNLICPRDPSRKVLGYRRILSSFTTTSSTVTQATGLSCPVIVPANRKVRVSFNGQLLNDTNSNYEIVSLWDGAVVTGTKLAETSFLAADNSATSAGATAAVSTPATASKTYNVGLRSSNNTNGVQIQGDALNPAHILVELV